MDIYQIYVILFMIGSVLLIGLWLHLRQLENRPPALETFTNIMLLDVGILVLQFFEISATDLNTKILFLDLKFALYIAVPVLLIKFVLEYTEEMKPVWQGIMRFLWGITAIMGILALSRAAITPYFVMIMF